MAFEDRVVEFPNRVKLTEVTSMTQEFTGDGSTTDYALATEPTAVTAVTIDGTATTAYTLDADVVSFSSAPAFGALVSVTFSCSGIYDLSRAEGNITSEGTALNAANLSAGVQDIVDNSMSGITIQSDGDVYYQNLQRGTVKLTARANTVVSVSVTFPHSFTQTPVVVATPRTTAPNTCMVSVANISVTGFTLYMWRTNGTSTNISWIATI